MGQVAFIQVGSADNLLIFSYFSLPPSLTRKHRINLNGFFAGTHDRVARQDHLVVAIVAKFSRGRRAVGLVPALTLSLAVRSDECDDSLKRRRASSGEFAATTLVSAGRLADTR